MKVKHNFDEKKQIYVPINNRERKRIRLKYTILVGMLLAVWIVFIIYMTKSFEGMKETMLKSNLAKATDMVPPSHLISTLEISSYALILGLSFLFIYMLSTFTWIWRLTKPDPDEKELCGEIQER